MSAIGKKQYELTIPAQNPYKSRAFHASIQDAILLSLLEKKEISLWQYEQCRSKLRLPPAEGMQDAQKSTLPT